MSSEITRLIDGGAFRADRLPIEQATRRQRATRSAGAASAGGTDPAAGDVLVGTDQLLGSPGSRPAAVDALAPARTLVKGEALAAPAGRADDFVWPRREVGREQIKETPVASTSPDGRSPLERCRSRRSRSFGRYNRVLRQAAGVWGTTGSAGV